MPSTFDRLKAALADAYALKREVGAGGMATVYLAEDLKHRRQVAIKVLREDLSAALGADRFLREIEIAANLSHPHIVPVHDSGDGGGFLYYVMPYVEGESLRVKLAREGRLSVTDTVRILRDVVDAVAHAHAKGVIHRDIKPDNVMLAGRHALVTDFGVAKALSEATVAGALTKAGVPLGTPAYMAPEQVAADPNIDHRADIYAIGVLAYELLTGRPPFTSVSPQEMLAAHIARVPEPVTKHRTGEVPPELEQLVMKCLEKQAADRWQTAEDLRAQLEGFATPSGAITPPETLPLLRARRTSRPWIAVAAAAATVGLAVTAVLGIQRRLAGPTTPTVATHRQVTFVGNVVEASISRQGDFLAYTTRDVDGTTLMVMEVESGSAIEIASSPDPIHLPNWSPDGRQILVARGTPGKYTHLVYPRLGGEPYARPVPGVSARWSVDGQRLYSWFTDWGYVSFSTTAPDSHTWIWTPDSTAWLIEAAEHPSGEALAVLQQARGDGDFRIWRLTVDSAQRLERMSRDEAGRTARHELLIEDAAQLMSVEWSPDGNALYYLREDQGAYQLWKLLTALNQLTGNFPKLLMSGLEMPVGDIYPAGFSLTEDGSQLFFVKGRAFSTLWSMRPRGDAWAVEQLTTGTATNLSPRASPDGEWVAYRSTAAGRTNVFIIPSEGGPSRQITRADSVSGDPVWAPDGESLAFGLRRGGRNYVATASVKGSPRATVFEASVLSSNGTLEWAPGSDILYQRPGAQNFHFLDPETGDERPLLSADSAAVGFPLQVRYSPDGTQLAIAWNQGEPGLYVISIADGGRTRLISQVGFPFPIGWSADGRTIYATSHNGRQVLAIPADGGSPTVLNTLPFEATWVATTNHGRWFVFASPETTGDVWRIENFDPEP